MKTILILLILGVTTVVAQNCPGETCELYSNFGLQVKGKGKYFSQASDSSCCDSEKIAALGELVKAKFHVVQSSCELNFGNSAGLIFQEISMITELFERMEMNKDWMKTALDSGYMSDEDAAQMKNVLRLIAEISPIIPNVNSGISKVSNSKDALISLANGSTNKMINGACDQKCLNHEFSFKKGSFSVPFSESDSFESVFKKLNLEFDSLISDYKTLKTKFNSLVGSLTGQDHPDPAAESCTPKCVKDGIDCEEQMKEFFGFLAGNEQESKICKVGFTYTGNCNQSLPPPFTHYRLLSSGSSISETLRQIEEKINIRGKYQFLTHQTSFALLSQPLLFFMAILAAIFLI